LSVLFVPEADQVPSNVRHSPCEGIPEMALLVGCKRLWTAAAPVPVLEKTLPRLVGMSPSQSFFTPRFVFGAPNGVVQRDSRGSLRSLSLGLVDHVVGTEASVKFYRCQFRMRRSTERKLGTLAGTS